MSNLTKLSETGLPVQLPGMTVATTPDHYSAFNVLRMLRFRGEGREISGEPVSARD